MRDILAEIVEEKRDTVEAAKREQPLYDIKRKMAYSSFRGSKRMRNEPWILIAECKLQSPVKGRLTKRHSVLELAHTYEDNGALMLSVHTDPHFLGSNEDFCAVRREIEIPLLRKDFIIDEYQIYESRLLGADAVLLIARILEREELKRFLYTTWSLGMDALIEVHDRDDMEKALATPAGIIGINNRNLATFKTSIKQTIELLPYADRNRKLISESGVFTEEDAKRLYAAGCDGVLVGEGLVRSADVSAFTRALAGIGRNDKSAQATA